MVSAVPSLALHPLGETNEKTSAIDDYRTTVDMWSIHSIFGRGRGSDSHLLTGPLPVKVRMFQ